METSSSPVLTARENEALLLLAQGYRVSEIGPRLGVSKATVEAHLKSARRKLGFSSSLLAARSVYGADAPTQNVGTRPSGMADGPSLADDGIALSTAETSSVHDDEGVRTASGADRRDLLARLLGGSGNRNGLSRPERLVVWLVLTALIGVGSFASLAIPYLVDALRHR